MDNAPRILIVDDDACLAEVTCEMLELAGASAIYRTTVPDAVDALARHADSLVALLTDVNMQAPMSGVDLAVQAAQQWPGLAICVTSGFSHERPRRLPERALFLAKPWRAPDLIGFLRGPAGLSDVKDVGSA